VLTSNPALLKTAAAASAFSFFKSASRRCFPALTLRAIATPINPDPIKTVTLFITTSSANYFLSDKPSLCNHADTSFYVLLTDAFDCQSVKTSQVN
jgi:hypothetical protein